MNIHSSLFLKDHKKVLALFSVLIMIFVSAAVMLPDESKGARNGTQSNPFTSLDIDSSNLALLFIDGHSVETTIYVSYNAPVMITQEDFEDGGDIAYSYSRLYSNSGFTTETNSIGGLSYQANKTIISGNLTSTAYIKSWRQTSFEGDTGSSVTLIPVQTSLPDTTQTATLTLPPGKTYNWTPTTSTGATLTVAASNSAMPTSGYATTSGYASISSGKLTVAIPSNYTGEHYYVSVKATSTNPTQNAYTNITFNTSAISLNYNITTVNAKVGTAITNLTPTLSNATAAAYSISGTLPAGLSFNTSTGVISGTPTAYKAQTNYTVTVTTATAPSYTFTKVVSIGAYTNITASNYTVYAIQGQTAINVPGVSMPTGTVLQGMTLTATKDNSNVTVTAETAYNGMTVEKNTGKITGTPNTAGTYKFTEKYTATAATGGSTAARTITIVVEQKVAIGGASSMNSFVGHSDNVTLTKTAGPGSVNWSITKITKNGTQINSGADFTGFSVNGSGVLTCGTGVTAGTYVVTVQLKTANTTTTTSGATGTNASSNVITKNVTVTVAAKITANNATFYEAAGGSYDALTLTSNISGATFTVTNYNGLSANSLNVASNGVVKAGSTIGNDLAKDTAYSVTVQAKDPKNSANTVNLTLSVYVKVQLIFLNSPYSGTVS